MVPKSWTAAILLPHVLDLNARATAEQMADIASFLGEEAEGKSTIEGATAATDAIRRMIAILDLPPRLREFGADLDDLIESATTARSFDMSNYAPRAVSTDDLFENLKTAY